MANESYGENLSNLIMMRELVIRKASQMNSADELENLFCYKLMYIPSQQ